MLSRIANSLFWMGRYLERAQHTARYVKVHYYSSLDAPLMLKKEFVLESILTMTGLTGEYKKSQLEMTDIEVAKYIAINEKNHFSIKNCIGYARENARGAKGSLSSELWEAINKFYHYVNGFTDKDIEKNGLAAMAEKTVEYCAIVNGYIDNTLLHNDTWALIHLGMHIERAAQITRILGAKVNDLKEIEKQKLGKAVETYQCITLLKSAEAFDMNRFHYKAIPNFRNSMEFLILNKEFPRSICYNFNEINKSLSILGFAKKIETDSVEFFVGKTVAAFNYLTIDEIEDNLSEFLKSTLDTVYAIGYRTEKDYLSY